MRAACMTTLIHHIAGVVVVVVCDSLFDDVLVHAGKFGSNIRPAFWRNVPFFLVPFWAASVLFSRPRQMPVVTADKVSFSRSELKLTKLSLVYSL